MSRNLVKGLHTHRGESRSSPCYTLIGLDYKKLRKLKTNKRQQFLEIFFSAFDAYQVLWIYQDEACIAGTVVYDPTNPDERQDFIWHMEEDKTPDEEAKTLLTHLKVHKLLHMDKLKIQAAEIVIPGMDAQSKWKAFDELFKVKVNMVDDGEVTGYYLIHE